MRWISIGILDQACIGINGRILARIRSCHDGTWTVKSAMLDGEFVDENSAKKAVEEAIEFNSRPNIYHWGM